MVVLFLDRAGAAQEKRGVPFADCAALACSRNVRTLLSIPSHRSFLH